MPNKELKKEDYWRIAEEITEKIKKWPEWKRNISLLDEEDVEKLTKESKPMSEKKETIEDRYEFPLNEWEHHVYIVASFDPKTKEQDEQFLKLILTRNMNNRRPAMASELVKEIEEMERLAREADDWFPMEITRRLLNTLQRAREALSRKEEQAPTKEKDLTTLQERAILKEEGQDG